MDHQSSYNASLERCFETGHFSVYGVGYKTFVPAFYRHYWATGQQITSSFAASRGLPPGTSDTTPLNWHRHDSYRNVCDSPKRALNPDSLPDREIHRCESRRLLCLYAELLCSDRYCGAHRTPTSNQNRCGGDYENYAAKPAMTCPRPSRL